MVAVVCVHVSGDSLGQKYCVLSAWLIIQDDEFVFSGAEMGWMENMRLRPQRVTYRYDDRSYEQQSTRASSAVAYGYGDEKWSLLWALSEHQVCFPCGRDGCEVEGSGWRTENGGRWQLVERNFAALIGLFSAHSVRMHKRQAAGTAQLG